MKKKADYNTLKHEMLSTIFELLETRKPEPVDFGTVIEKAHEKYPSTEIKSLEAILDDLHSGGYLLAEDYCSTAGLYILKLTKEGNKAYINETFIQESKKEKRASRNETGQIISPYIALAALLITTVFFIVDKCSTPTSYEITIDEKVYHLKQK